MTSTLAALVPMKAHSERIPKKNVREFNGRPLFHWILNTLQSVSPIDEIIVNTDSERIGEAAAAEFDATVLERPEELRGGHVSMNQIILHDVEKTNHGQYLQTHCTNPLLRPKTVEEAIDFFRDSKYHDSVFSVTPLQTRLWDEECEPVNHERGELLRTQDLPPIFEENSNLYLFTPKSVKRRGNRIGDEPAMFEMNEREAVDIDEPIDFRMAEFLHRDEYGDDPSLYEVISA